MFKTRKIIIFITIFLVILFNNLPIFADDEEIEEDINNSELQELIALESSSSIVNEPILNAKAAVIYDRTTKKAVWGKNENSRVAMASTTKIMTAIVVIENSNLSDTVTISKKAANIGGSKLKLKENDKITVSDLLYGLMLRSR